MMPGKTVLSYFPTKVDGLLPLDRVMLRGWYSPRMRGGMTPFEVLPVLADELVTSMPDKDRAVAARDRFFRSTIDQMQAFGMSLLKGESGEVGLVKQALGNLFPSVGKKG